MERKLLDKIIEAIKTYNKYRSPEAYAELLSINNSVFKVKFTGSFCLTCGIRDWVEDLVYVLMDYGVEAELIEYIEPDNEDENYRIGVFELKKTS